MLVRAPLMKAKQNSSIRILNLAEVIMARRSLGLAEECLIPSQTAGDVADANDCPSAFHYGSAVALTIGHFEVEPLMLLNPITRCSVRSIARLYVIDRYRFNPLRAPSRGLEWIGEVLGFMRHFSISKLHYAHGVDALAFVGNCILSHPEIAFAYDPAHRKARWPARMMTTKRLQVTPATDYLA